MPDIVLRVWDSPTLLHIHTKYLLIYESANKSQCSCTSEYQADVTKDEINWCVLRKDIQDMLFDEKEHFNVMSWEDYEPFSMKKIIILMRTESNTLFCSTVK